MNTPYVKRFDENGVLTNPIDGKLVHKFPNRRQRKAKPKRFMNNSKSFKMVVHQYGNGKFERFRMAVQMIGTKKVLHYLPV